MAKKILIDTDIGTDSDDAIALALAAASSELEIVGVITTGREARHRARLAKKFLHLAGKSQVPVFVGANTPVGEGELYWFGHEGHGIITDDEGLELDPRSGVDAYRDLCNDIPDLEVVAIGSMSTLARAITAYPEIIDQISRITIMGGHIRTTVYADTTIGPGIDYNLCIDPAASMTTLTSGATITLIPCEVTLQTWLTFADADRIALSGPVGQALRTCVQAWAPIQRAIFTGVGVGDNYDPNNADFLHDPLTVATTFASDVCVYENLWIEPTTVDGIFRTLERPADTPGAVLLQCATEVRTTRFHELLMGRLAQDAVGSLEN